MCVCVGGGGGWRYTFYNVLFRLEGETLKFCRKHVFCQVEELNFTSGITQSKGEEGERRGSGLEGHTLCIQPKLLNSIYSHNITFQNLER